MRIGIDSLLAATHPPGAGRYARELVRALIELDDRPDLALFEVGPGRRVYSPRERGVTPGDSRVTRVEGTTSRRWLALAGRYLGRGADLRVGGVDLFHHTSLDALPVARARQTLALSELPRADDARTRALARMDGIVVFSADMRAKVLERLRLSPERVFAVHVGCEHWRRTLAELPPRDDPPRIVVLGAVRSARFPSTILRAFEHLVASGIDARLDFLAAPVPPNTPVDPAALELKRALATSSARDQVSWVGSRARDPSAAPFDPKAFEASLPRLVASASVLVHLTAEEGTPVTPLEAFALGVPVVTSRIPAFEEALGTSSEWVDTWRVAREPELLADAIARAITSGRDAHATARRLLIAREHTWARCARETLGFWRTVIDR